MPTLTVTPAEQAVIEARRYRATLATVIRFARTTANVATGERREQALARLAELDAEWARRHYTCDVPVGPKGYTYPCESTSTLPHHSCTLHHDPMRVDCEGAMAMLEADEALMGYAL
jgi:hypothetical protein